MKIFTRKVFKKIKKRALCRDFILKDERILKSEFWLPDTGYLFLVGGAK